MSRYIDAEKLVKAVQQWDMQDLYLPVHFLDLIDNVPTAEVVKGVRCKDCKFFKEFRDSVKEKSVDGVCMTAMLHRCDEQFSLKSNDDYCSCGEPIKGQRL